MKSLIFEALARLIAGQTPMGPVRSSEVDSVEAGPITVFFGFLENDPTVRSKIHQEYFLRPHLMNMQRKLRNGIVDNWLQGQPPLTVDGLFNMAVSIAGDPGTSLLLCHNVLKSMSRSSESLPWNRVRSWPARESRPPETAANLFPQIPTVSLPILPDDYTDGIRYYRPTILNTSSNAFLDVKYQNSDHINSYESIWYVLFDHTSYGLGSADAGDWYHFFLMACLGYYAAMDRVSGLEEEDELGPPNTDIFTVSEADVTWNFIKRLIEGIQSWDLLAETFVTMGAKRRAWVWANALSYLEGSYFGAKVDDPNDLPTQAEKEDVLRESRAHHAGLLFGMYEADPANTPDLGWKFWVPMPGRLRAARMRSLDDFHNAVNQLSTLGPGANDFTYGYLLGQTAQFYPWDANGP